MSMRLRIETALETAIARAEAGQPPPKLAAALRHAVFPGGARVRPQICLAVAEACGDDAPHLAEASAAAVELLHCASLVHDDLPCFDNADVRRGQASVHAAFGEPIAVLAGDALIVMAFDAVARAGVGAPGRVVPILTTIARGVGMPGGIVAGQAWESEPQIAVEAYHRAKTGALFVAAVMCGALAAGANPLPWQAVGEKLGEAYQVADDLLDAVSMGSECGKPVGQDCALGRPSAVKELGVDGACARLRSLVEQAVTAIPPCEGGASLGEIVRMQATRLVPKQLVRGAA